MVFEEDKFTIQSKDGNYLEFYKLLSFNSKITNKSYIVYSDNNKNIYASILNNTGGDIVLERIEDEIDLNEVNKAILEIKININYVKDSKDGKIIDSNSNM